MAEAFAFARLCRCGIAACNTHEVVEADPGQVVLPPSAEPIKYVLELTTRPSLDTDDHTFDGRVEIKVEVRAEDVTSLTLHAKDLQIHTASFGGVGDATSIDLDGEAGTVTLGFGRELPVGVGKLTISFTGEHNNQMNGFYRSTYKNMKGEDRTMISTQFESIDARKCFPCWDEPRRKATFECSLRIPAHLTALSNMPEACSTHHDDGTKTVRFMPSPRMSTYLLAFVVGEFDHVSALTKNGVVIRVFGPRGKPELGSFALECAVAALDLYDEAFGVPYPLPKSDMVAIPEFAAGAMENWGLVTYREVDLLIDAAASSRQRQRVAEVVIHELAHQWFGNLVTMEWWDDLWLNEGFATWMETGITDRLHPDWRMWEQFITDMQGRALDLDALRSSHPIQVPIGKAEEVDQVFDAISYCKGGSVVRLVHAVVGEEAFLRGLRSYMSSFKYGNATTSDLWAAWEEASGQPITQMMTLWTRQMGFPLLEVVSAEPADGSVTLSLRQGWFLADGSEISAAEQKKWSIPLFAASSGCDSPPPMSLMHEATHSLTLPGDGLWVKLNAGQHVPMRVKYPDSMVPALATAIRSKAIPAIDRIGLLADHHALAKARKLAPISLLELLAAYDQEDEPTVLSELILRLSSLHALFTSDPPLQNAFDDFAASLISPLVKKLGWDPRSDDGHLTRKLRGELIAALPSLCIRDYDVHVEARRRYDLYISDASAEKTEGKEHLPAEIAAAAFKLVASNGGETEFEQLLGLFETLPLNDDKKQALFGLGYAPTAELRERALRFAMTDSVKLQDFFYVALVMHRAGADGMESTWAFFQANLPLYQEKLSKAGGSLMDACITGACSGFATAAKAAEVEAFFAANPLPKNERKVSQTLEAIRNNCAFLDSFLSSTALQWLQARAKRGAE